MNDYIMISNYMNNDKYRTSFNELAKNTFGLDFEQWFQNNLFYDRYICYSYINNEEEIIANVSVNKMNLIIEGKDKTAIQLGTVMTNPKYRNKGLSSALINKIIEEYNSKCDFIYLFANNSVLDFYPKFGFKRVIENAYEIKLNDINVTRSASKIRKLDKNIIEDYEIIKRLVVNRMPISQKLGVYNDAWPLFVYCLYECSDNLYYMLEEDIIVIFHRENGKLSIYDVLSIKTVNLDYILERIIIDEDQIVEFNFIPELHKYITTCSLMERANDNLFIRTKNEGFKQVLFPITSHT